MDALDLWYEVCIRSDDKTIRVLSCTCSDFNRVMSEHRFWYLRARYVSGIDIHFLSGKCYKNIYEQLFYLKNGTRSRRQLPREKQVKQEVVSSDLVVQDTEKVAECVSPVYRRLCMRRPIISRELCMAREKKREALRISGELCIQRAKNEVVRRT